LAAKLGDLERKIAGHDEGIRTLFEAIRALMTTPDKPRRSIGFRVEEAAAYEKRRLRRIAVTRDRADKGLLRQRG